MFCYALYKNKCVPNNLALNLICLALYSLVFIATFKSTCLCNAGDRGLNFGLILYYYAEVENNVCLTFIGFLLTCVC